MSELKSGTLVRLLREVKSPTYQGMGIYIVSGTLGIVDNDDIEVNGEIVSFINIAYQTRLLLQRDDFEVGEQNIGEIEQEIGGKHD